jgi:putative phosphoribosyl transferase
MDSINPPPFQDRRDAGRQLADALLQFKNEDPVVLALPRGGVPVAYEVAQMLDAPLDILMVRKIGAPGYPELGLGAVVDGQHYQRVLNQKVVDMIKPPPGYIEAEEQRQIQEIERRRKLYCGDRLPVAIEGRTVIVVDDGVATGGTMKTSLAALSAAGVKRLLFAVPVAPPDTLNELYDDADDGVCLMAPESFRAVSPFYGDFSQTTDGEVISLLEAAAQRPTRSTASQERPPASASNQPSADRAQRSSQQRASSSNPPAGRS